MSTAFDPHIASLFHAAFPCRPEDDMAGLAESIEWCYGQIRDALAAGDLEPWTVERFVGGMKFGRNGRNLDPDSWEYETKVAEAQRFAAACIDMARADAEYRD